MWSMQAKEKKGKLKQWFNVYMCVCVHTDTLTCTKLMKQWQRIKKSEEIWGLEET